MRRMTTLLAGLALTLAACGGGPSPEATEDTTTGEESLAAFFGWNDEDPEASEARYREEQAQVEESVRQCMAEAGFEYQPQVMPDSAFSAPVEEDMGEYYATQGFGISTWYGRDDETTDTTVAGEEWIDPNQEMLDAMSDTERQAWYDELYGSEEEQMEDLRTEVDPDTGEEYQVSDGYGAGCYGEAYQAQYGDQNDVNALWEEINPMMETMYEQVQADPRIVELDQAWAACMSDAGYEYESMNAMYESVYTDFQTRFDEIVGPNGGYVDPMADWTQEEIESFFNEKTQEEIDAFFAEAETSNLANIDQDALSALQQEEIDLAVAAYECQGDYYEVYQDISEEYEADFIAANREVLEQIRDAQDG